MSTSTYQNLYRTFTVINRDGSNNVYDSFNVVLYAADVPIALTHFQLQLGLFCNEESLSSAGYTWCVYVKKSHQDYQELANNASGVYDIFPKENSKFIIDCGKNDAVLPHSDFFADLRLWPTMFYPCDFTYKAAPIHLEPGDELVLVTRSYRTQLPQTVFGLTHFYQFNR